MLLVCILQAMPGMWHSPRVLTNLKHDCILCRQMCSMKSDSVAYVPPADLMSPLSYWPSTVCPGKASCSYATEQMSAALSVEAEAHGLPQGKRTASCTESVE